MVEVTIALQARSGSKRLPGKSLALIEDAVMIDHCLNAAKQAANFINSRKAETNISANVCLLIPHNDPIKEAMGGGSLIFEGPEDNVLERFRIAQKKLNPDFMVRITGDCPLQLPTLINKHIFSAIAKDLDYCSNSYDDLRTFADGYDCEVISKRLMDWLYENAKTREELEHVTILAKSNPPPWARYGVVMGHNDFSHVKISVDTKEELEFVRANRASMLEKIELARSRKLTIFRF